MGQNFLYGAGLQEKQFIFGWIYLGTSKSPVYNG